MSGYDQQLIADDELITIDPVAAAARLDRLRQQFRNSERLNKYYNEVLAELRVSLAQIDQDDHSS
jgi:hypothetical protein